MPGVLEIFIELAVVSSLEDLAEDFVGLEEDGLWDDGVAVRARNGPGGDVLWGAARRLGLFFAPSQGIVEEYFGDTEYDLDNYARCGACDCVGTVRTFQDEQ